MKTHLFEIQLVAGRKKPNPGEILLSVLEEAGIPVCQLCQQVQAGKTTVSTFTRSFRHAERIKKKFVSLRLKGIRFYIRKIVDDSWKNKWKDQLRPFCLTGNFDVVPLWHADRYEKGGHVPIYLDTTFAFGTGLHETTRFLAALIDLYRGKFTTFLDIGTGTGLLAILARHSGARDVFGVDSSLESVRTARQNMKHNGFRFTGLQRISFERYKARQKFDFVAANLTSRDLVSMRRKIISVVRPGGWLGVSGISIEHLNAFRKDFSKYPLRCLRVLKGKEWAAVVYKKR